MVDSLAGRLLVATPLLTDPNFARTVVLLCAHDEDGAFGVVLNRPLANFGLVERLPGWGAHADEPRVLFSGGPVDKSVAVGLARFHQRRADATDAQLPHGLALIDLTQPAEEALPGLTALRVFAGYSGWGAGQLEREIEEEAWFVIETDGTEPFNNDPAGLWRQVLRRQGGRLAMFAYFPLDPAVN